MKNNHIFSPVFSLLTIFACAMLLAGSCSRTDFEKAKKKQRALSDSYPHDTGIEKDPDVLYVEKFDDGMENILSRYSDILNSYLMAVDADLQKRSLRPNSFNLTNTC